MRAPTLLLSISIAVGVVACKDAMGPTRIQRSISSIRVPVSAAAADTIHITFNVDAGGCDTGVMVESQLTSDSMRFSASSEPSTGVCPVTAIARSYSYIVFPTGRRPFTVSFAEPGQADNVFGVVAP